MSRVLLSVLLFLLVGVGCPVPLEDLAIDKFVLQFTRLAASSAEGPNGEPGPWWAGADVVQKRVKVTNTASGAIDLHLYFESFPEGDPSAATISAFHLVDLPVVEGLAAPYNTRVDGSAELAIYVVFDPSSPGQHTDVLVIEEPESGYVTRVVLQGVIDCISLGDDIDHDGYCEAAPIQPDCDDAQALIHPNAGEICESGDQVDNDCDGLTDVAVDADNDGYCDATSCAATEDTLPASCEAEEDCDDEDAGVRPGGVEHCEVPDGSQPNFGQVNDNCEASDDLDVLRRYVPDSDADSFGTELDNDQPPLVSCDLAPPDGYVACPIDAGHPETCLPDQLDCNDESAAAAPDGAVEVCDSVDNACDGDLQVAPGINDEDNDADGVSVCDGDCADADAARRPGVAEICNRIDDDCSGAPDDDEVDDDGDGYVECQVGTTPGPGEGDCDDTIPTVYPGAPILCNEYDDNCDNLLDPGDVDLDGDGVRCDEDCGPNDPTMHQGFLWEGEPEICDGKDNDCDGVIPDNESDVDGDGWTVCLPLTIAPLGYTGLVGYVGGGDCNDDASLGWAPYVYPEAPEIADSFTDGTGNFVLIDNQCPGDPGYDDDGLADAGEYCESTEITTAGDCATGPCFQCVGGEFDDDGDHWTAAQGDCDDNDAARSPGEPEVCDGLDNDCDSLPGTPETDDDGDGFVECWPVPGSVGIVGGDCDDTTATTAPGSPELPDGIDQDCDGSTEVAGEIDQDGDCYCSVTVPACNVNPASACASTQPGDCDDWNAARNPGEPEVCDEIDNNCDGLVGDDRSLGNDERDRDGDGYTHCGDGDCVDHSSDILGYAEVNAAAAATAIHPFAPEVCDGWDTDCTTGSFQADRAEELDDDGDLYVECDDVIGQASAAWGDWAAHANLQLDGANDCADTAADLGGVGAAAPTVHPGATEICDGWDNDCQGALAPFSTPDTTEHDDDGDAWIDCTLTGTPPLPNGIDGGSDCLDLSFSATLPFPKTGQTVGLTQAAATYPTAAELCDGIDNDCSSTNWATPADDEDDTDGDHYITCLPAAASLAPGYLAADCLDNAVTTFSRTGQAIPLTVSAMVNPGAAEVCDGLDTDCSSGSFPATDESEDDTDGDHYLACTAVAASVAPGFAAGDCADNAFTQAKSSASVPIATAALIHPGLATDVCDGFDTDCSQGLNDVSYPTDTDEDDADADLYLECATAISTTAPGMGLLDCSEVAIGGAPGQEINPGEADDHTYPHVDNDCDNIFDEESVSVGDLVINEVMAVPAASDNEDWAELRNVSSRTVYIRNWELLHTGTVSATTTLSQDLSVSAGGYLVLCRNPTTANALNVACANSSNIDALQLRNATELLSLRRPDPSDSPTPAVIDTVSWAAATTFTGADTAAGFNPGVTSAWSTQNDVLTNWCTQGCDFDLDADCNGDKGTPGRQNSSCTSLLRDADFDQFCAGGRDLSTPRDGDCDDSGEGLANQVTPVGTCAATVCDCLDSNAAVRPRYTTSETVEVCDGWDTDCSTGVAVPATGTDEYDDDTDRYIDCTTTFVNNGALNSLSQSILSNNDCADTNLYRFPSNPEICDGFDNDCAGTPALPVNETDGDNDQYLSCTTTFINHAASNTQSELILGNNDCADGNEWRNPAAAEVCDGYDNDCSGSALATEVDADTDQYLVCSGFISHGALNTASEALLGGSDCADSNEWRNPAAAEVCDGYDNDCNGATTSGSGETDPDNDRYIACSGFVSHGATNAASQTILTGGDCLDIATTSNSWSDDVKPGAAEVCDSWDSDCSTPATAPAVPSGAPEVLTEIDNDLDNYVDCTLVANVVTRSPVVGGSDCNDGNIAIFPTAIDNITQEGVDNDCDSLIDEASVLAGDLVVNEFLARAQSDPGDEYVELLNTTSRTLRLVGWRITDGAPSGESYTVPALTVAAGGYIVLCRDETTADGAGCANVGSPMSSFALATTTDTIQISIPDLVSPLTVDAVAYSATFNQSNHKAFGLSVDLLTNRHVSNDTGGNWCSQLLGFGTSSNKGTPGLANNSCDNTLRDEDGDAYCPSGHDNNSDGDCSDGVGETDALGECDDTNAYRFPGNAEICDGFDNDCSGSPSVPANETDEDLDEYIECTGYVDHAATNSSSTGLLGGGDCLDTTLASNTWSDDVRPGTVEVCDSWDTNCNNTTGLPDQSNEQDDDGDTYIDCSPVASGAVLRVGITGVGDCVDLAPASNSYSDDIRPGAAESCDSWDTDCSVFANAGAPDQNNEIDNDGDNYIDCSPIAVGTVFRSPIIGVGDCVDTAAVGGTWADDIHPNASELCDGWDTNCTSFAAAGAPDIADEQDDDLDNYFPCSPLASGAVPPAGKLGGRDCLDVTVASNSWSDNVNPGASELCDGWDTNCTNTTGLPDQANEQDDDLDAYVACGSAASGAVLPVGILGTADCLDIVQASNSWSDNVNPGATEICDGWDTDCDIFVNGGAPDEANETDNDGDSYIDCGASLVVGAVPPSGVVGAGDCVDSAAAAYSSSIKPGVTDVCDSWDTNCTVFANSGAPDAADEQDGDGDGYIPCTPILGSAVYRPTIIGGADCLDVSTASNSWSDDVKPGVTDVCDGWDTNCTSATNGGAADLITEIDNDGDQYLDCSPLASGAVLPSGIVGVGDCMDLSATAGTWADDIHPTASELCDGWDTNCTVFGNSGAADQNNEIDHDGDQYIDCASLAVGAVLPAGLMGAGDCLDVAVATNSWSDNVNPGAVEDSCDSWDTNCTVFANSGAPTTGNEPGEMDNDGDNYIGCATLTGGAVPRSPIVGAGDCLDVAVATNAWSDNVNPGATEVCDTWDTNCSVFASGGTPQVVNDATEMDDDGDNYIACATLVVGAVLRSPIVGVGDCLDVTFATNSWSDDVRPGATEVCDSWDTNCTVFANSGVPTTANEPTEMDIDGDNYVACSPLASGAVLRVPVVGVGDCLDVTVASNSWSDNVNPGAVESCDSWDTNCTVFANAGAPDNSNEIDHDGDNYIDCATLVVGAVLRAPILGAGDCLDVSVASNSWSDNVNPGATEVCDTWDTNCSVFASGGTPQVVNDATEMDDDEDNYIACATLVVGAVLRSPIVGVGDCLDVPIATNSWSDDVRPGATEVCDSWDTNCTVFANAGVPTTTNEQAEMDDDGDNYIACSPLAVGAVFRSPIIGVGDCLDVPTASNSWSDDVRPGASEVCDSWDTNCSTFANAGVPDDSNEIDDDGDNYIDCATLVVGAVLRAPILGAGDCLDVPVASNSWSDNVNPGQVGDACDSWDTNCTIFANAGAPDVTTEIDEDGDTYIECSPLAGGAVFRAPVTGVGDCVDVPVATNSWSDNIRPGTPEVCDSWDTDCSTYANAGAPDANNEIDNDSDTYIDCFPLAVGATYRAPVVGVGDCVDTTTVAMTWADNIRPGVAEVCDGWDTDCTIFASAGAADLAIEIDSDGDQYIDCGPMAVGAVFPTGILGVGDCNDLSATARTGVTVPDSPGSAVLISACEDPDSDGYCVGGGEDLNTDGDCAETGEDYESRIADGASLAWGDCDEGVAGITLPSVSEDLLDGTDNNSDGYVDEDCLAAGIVIVTEIHSDDTDTDPDQLDWYEVWNASWHDVCIDGWTVTDDAVDTYTIPGASGGACGRNIEPRTRAVLSQSDYIVLGSPFVSLGDPIHVWGLTPVFSIENIGESGKNDRIQLAAGATVVDVLDYGPSWPNPANGTSLELGDAALPTHPSGTANDASGSWCVAAATTWANGIASPGTANFNCP